MTARNLPNGKSWPLAVETERWHYKAQGEGAHRFMAGTLYVAFRHMSRTGSILLLEEENYDLPPTLAI